MAPWEAHIRGKAEDLFSDFYAYGLQLLPAGTVGEAYHEVISALSYVLGDGDVDGGLV